MTGAFPTRNLVRWFKVNLEAPTDMRNDFSQIFFIHWLIQFFQHFHEEAVEVLVAGPDVGRNAESPRSLYFATKHSHHLYMNPHCLIWLNVANSHIQFCVVGFWHAGHHDGTPFTDSFLVLHFGFLLLTDSSFERKIFVENLERRQWEFRVNGDRVVNL